jgi:phosphatidylserine/phosphatidylglycerophosphate/cardiolipin synthase-like enzyme
LGGGVILEGFLAEDQQPRRQPLDRPLSGVNVDLIDATAVHDETRLGPRATTNAAGLFSVPLPVPRTPAQLRLRITTGYGRSIVLDLTDADVAILTADGQRIVIIVWIRPVMARRMRAPAPTGHGFVLPDLEVTLNRVLPMVDNELAWSTVTEETENSTADRPVEIMTLGWAPGVYTTFDMPPPKPDEPKRTVSGKKLEDVAVSLSKKQPLKPIRLLFNSSIEADDAEKVAKRIADAGATGIAVKGFIRPNFNGVVHSKNITIGDVGFLLGSPFWQNYYDGSAHQIDDGRRGLPLSAYHLYYFVSVPVHEVSVALQGPAVATLRKHFFQLWNNAGLAPTADVPETPGASAAKSWPTAAVQIARTMPGFTNPGAPLKRVDKIPELVPDGETDILDAYLYAIRAAKRFIYMENQYFIEQQIADALIKALKRAPELRVIILFNVNTDIPSWYGRQLRTVLDLKKRAAGIGAAGRLLLYTLWAHEQRADGSHVVMRNYIHAKTAVVDDLWATIGSANLDEISLDRSPVAIREPDERAVEVNAFIFNNVDGQPASVLPESIRRLLWAEHLGFLTPDGDPDPTDSRLDLPAGGDPAAQWTARAIERQTALKTPTIHPAKILPWNVHRNDKDHFLAAVGSKKLPPKLKVQEQFRGYDLAKSEWKKA